MSILNLTDIHIFLYYITFGVLFFLSVIAFLARSRSVDSFILTISFVFALCFYSMLGVPGTDATTYLSQFNNLSSYNDFEWGYSLYFLMKSAKFISNSGEVYLFITVFFYLVVTISSIFLLVKSPAKSFCFLIYVLSFSYYELMTNVYRQGIASSFLLLSAYFLIQRRIVFFLLTSSIAIGFHWSSLMIIMLMLTAYFIYKKHNIVLLILSVVFFLNILSVVSSKGFFSGGSIFQKLSINYSFIFGDIISKMGAYVNPDIDGARFSEINLTGRINSLFEITISIFICSIFLFLNINGNIKDDLMTPVFENRNLYFEYFVALLSLLGLYNVLLIDMVWFIRNCYWALIVIPIIYSLFLSNETDVKVDRVTVVCFSLLYFIFSTLSFWRHPNLVTNKITYLFL